MLGDVDKPLPNTNQTQAPNEEIIEVEKTKSAEVIDTPTGPVEVDMTEDGGAEVSFNPSTSKIDPNQDHFANLAETMDDGDLDSLGNKMIDQYNEYKESRGDWEDTYKNGLAVVTIERDACGGCYNQVPAQIQLELSQRKRIINCEHCARVLVASNIEMSLEELAAAQEEAE